MKGCYKPQTHEDISKVETSVGVIQDAAELAKINSQDHRPLFMNQIKLEPTNLEEHQGNVLIRKRKRRRPDHDGDSSTGRFRHCMALLVEMVLPPDHIVSNEPLQSTTSSTILSNKTASVDYISAPSLDDQSCPIEFRYRDYYDKWRFPIDPEGKIKLEASKLPEQSRNSSDRFHWDAGMQGVLLGACAVGTAPLQIFGGRLSEIYGPKWVLMSASLGTAITSLTVPAFARYSFKLLVLNRIVMGISQAGLEPALVCLMVSWLVPKERSFFISLLLFAICLGSFIGMLVTSIILSWGYSWSTTFYVAGYLNLLVSVLWLFLASSRPSESKLLTTRELDYIQRSQLSFATGSGEQPSGEAAANGKGAYLKGAGDEVGVSDVSQAPWARILSCRPVWAFIICKVATRWCADVVSSELPTYLANVLHLSIKLNGIVNSISAALFTVFSFLTGYMVNEISRGRLRALHDNRPVRLSKTNLRKMFQVLASFGSALNLLLMVRYDCDLAVSIAMLLVLSCSLVLSAGGELQIPYDMTSKYPGTLHGIACTLSVSGWLAPPTIGLILGDEPSSRYRWSIVWHLTAAINFIGGLVFVLFADASARDFDSGSDSSTTKGGRPWRLWQPVAAAEAGRTPASNHKKEPAAGVELVASVWRNKPPPGPACYVNVVCEIAERNRATAAQPASRPALAAERSALELAMVGELCQEHNGEEAAAESRLQKPPLRSVVGRRLKPEEVPLEWSPGCEPAATGGREPLAALHSPLGRRPPKPAAARNCNQVTGGGSSNAASQASHWWLRGSLGWRLWTRLAGRQGKFSVAVAADGQGPPEMRQV